MKKLLFILIPFFLSCSEDKEEPTPIDPKLEVIGQYDYAAVITSQQDRNNVTTTEGTFSLITEGTSGFKISGDIGTLFFTGVNKASNGFVFNVQSFVDPETQFEVSGMNSVSFENLNYHGKYDSGSKQITFALLFSSDNGSAEMEVIATKQ